MWTFTRRHWPLVALLFMLPSGCVLSDRSPTLTDDDGGASSSQDGSLGDVSLGDAPRDVSAGDTPRDLSLGDNLDVIAVDTRPSDDRGTSSPDMAADRGSDMAISPDVPAQPDTPVLPDTGSPPDVRNDDPGVGVDVQIDVPIVGGERGTACSTQSPCKAGLSCADGYCCDSACNDACHACNLRDHIGTCWPTSNGTAPASGHPACGPDAADTCKRDGMCDGAGNCRNFDVSTMCKPAVCNAASNTVTPTSTCDGQGTCVTPAAASCAPLICKDATSCYQTCTDTTQCAGGKPCTNGSCGPKPTGATCQNSGECASTHCADGVCCDTDCTAGCMACNLGSTLGKCTAVPSGQDPHGVCAAGTGANATCAPGGCDGNGAGCRYASSSTVCRSSTCTSGSMSSAANCSGNGQCASPTVTSCGSGACNAAGTNCLDCGGQMACNGACCSAGQGCCGNQCITLDKSPNCGTCGTTCPTGQTCGGTGTTHSCLWSDGHTCTSTNECASGVCGGRCCRAGSTCTCPQPTSANLIRNPGFDQNESEWTYESIVGTFRWQSGTTTVPGGYLADAEGCPWSGAAILDCDFQYDSCGRVWQCVEIQQQTSYTFGVRLGSDARGEMRCSVEMFSGPGCVGAGEYTDAQFRTDTGWSNVFLSHTFGSGANMSAKVNCERIGLGTGTFDMVFLSKVPGGY